jgi:hypothetical protein
VVFVSDSTVVVMQRSFHKIALPVNPMNCSVMRQCEREQKRRPCRSLVVEGLTWNSCSNQQHVPLQGASVQRQTGCPEASHPLYPSSSTMMFFISESSLISDRYSENIRAHVGPRTWRAVIHTTVRKEKNKIIYI